MNVLFGFLFFISTALLLFLDPQNFLSTLLDGASSGATVCVSLVATYAVWLGLIQIWKDSGISQTISRLLRPISKKLFRTDDPETLDNVCMNLSVNLLGISGAATPYGIRAAQLLDKSENAEYASSMFFILNATSIQLIPTSIIAMRVSLGSASPADIVLPTLLTTAFSTVLGALLCRIFIPPKRKASHVCSGGTCGYIRKTKGAGV